jgi:ribosome recycling factor
MGTPNFEERQEIAKQFAGDVERMRRSLQSTGRDVTDDEIVRA